MNKGAGMRKHKVKAQKCYGHRERGEDGEMYGESNMETYVIICKIDSKKENE